MVDGPRERLINSAIHLVRRNGLAGTGIAELLEHSKTARRSIYMHFPRGKDELIETSTRAAGTVMSATIARLTASDDPAQSIEAFVRMWRSILADSDFTAGCPVVAAALGGSEAQSAPAAAAAVFRDWERLISAQLVRLGVPTARADSLATMTIGSVEGAIVLAIASRSLQPLERTQLHLTELVEHDVRVAAAR